MKKFCFDLKSPSHWRITIQWLFLGWCLFIGVQFGLFVRHFSSMGQTGYYPRPPSVEAFLPIGALVSLKSWIVNGQIDPVHPAALVLFVTFCVMALLSKKSFCSFICPVGTLSEGAWKIGQRLFGRNFRIWRWLDNLLRALKYIALLFFVNAILIGMPAAALKGFMAAPYWSISDIKMLHFFTSPSTTSLSVIMALTLLSVLYRNLWCRYLCPYGALLGLISILSPIKVRRYADHCTDCGACSRACPSQIDVQHKQRVHSPECTACLTCVSHCPEPGALNISAGKRALSGRVFVALVMVIFAAGFLSGKFSGNWQTSLDYVDYQRLIPLAGRLGH